MATESATTVTVIWDRGIAELTVENHLDAWEIGENALIHGALVRMPGDHFERIPGREIRSVSYDNVPTTRIPTFTKVI